MTRAADVWQEPCLNSTLGDQVMRALQRMAADGTYCARLYGDAALDHWRRTVYADRALLAQWFVPGRGLQGLTALCAAICEAPADADGTVDAGVLTETYAKIATGHTHAFAATFDEVEAGVALLSCVRVRSVHATPSDAGSELRALPVRHVYTPAGDGGELTVTGYEFGDRAFCRWAAKAPAHTSTPVFTASHFERGPIDARCSFSGSCYKYGKPVHVVVPQPDAASYDTALYGAYVDGCPLDEAACESAQLCRRVSWQQ